MITNDDQTISDAEDLDNGSDPNDGLIVEIEDNVSRHESEFGLFHATGLNDHQTLARRVNVLQGRQVVHRGVMQMNCLEAPEACQNACYFQDCVQGANGDITKYEYKYGDGNPRTANLNRVQSGVTTNHGRPCRNWPLAQRFWDSYQFTTMPNVISTDPSTSLETDEWPMASMHNEPFDTSADPSVAQHSLRCITQASNGAGGRMLKDFHRGDASYEGNGIYANLAPGQQRLGQGPIQQGEKFFVNFNFDSFDMTNTTHQRIRRSAWSSIPSRSLVLY
jgi:hypothetical protein